MIYTATVAARRFGVRREDVLEVSEERGIGRKVGTTFTYTREELDDLEDALDDEGLLEDEVDSRNGDEDGGEE